MRLIVGIPARLESSRYYGKVLCSILGMPMIEHIYKRCQLCDGIDELFVATYNDEIREVVEGFGGNVIMVSPDKDRAPGETVAEACEKINVRNNDIVVVVQGDEPLFHPDMICMVAEEVKDNKIYCCHMMNKASDKDCDNPDEVKGVCDEDGFAIYFSRSPIPSKYRNKDITRLKQVCVFAFKYKNLKEFLQLDSTPLQMAESIEMLKMLEHKKRLKLKFMDYATKSVDTKRDRRIAEMMMKNDRIYKEWFKEEII